jgi:Arm DNA-binding domain
MKILKSTVDALTYRDTVKITDKGTAYSADIRWDDTLPAFGVRVYPNGRKSFVISYRHRGRKRQMVLGKYGILTVDKARKKARGKLADVLEGKDPLVEKKKKQAA